jgi:hypothetical protein
MNPDDLLTPTELADRLKVSVSWVFEQTRNRAKVRHKVPLPVIRLTPRVLRFSWSAVAEWLTAQNSG